MAKVNFHKVVAALPAQLEPNAIYCVRAGAGMDVYVTNNSGQIVAYPANKPATDLSVTRDALSMVVRSSTRSGAEGDAYLPLANAGANLAGLMSGAQAAKLASLTPGSQQVGDVTITARAPGSLYLPLSAGIYLQSAYPELFAVMGLGKNDPASAWTRMTSPVPPIGSTSFFGAVATDNKGRYIALVTGGGSGYTPGYIALSEDHGVTWSAQQIATVVQNDLATDGNGTWCVVGPSGTQLRRSTDNGQTWVASNPFPASNISASAVDTDGNGVWVAAGNTGNPISRSIDNGLTWTTVATPIAQPLLLVRTNRKGIWIAGGLNGTVLRSTDNGITWVVVNAGFGATAVNHGLGSNGRNTWVIAGNNVIRRSTDGGLTWGAVTGAPTTTGSGSVVGNTSGSVWLLALDGFTHRSLDDGFTWSALTTAGIQNRGIATDSKGTWVVGGRVATLYRGLPTYDFDPATQFQLPDYMTPEGLGAYIRAKSA